jgi:hypothetical protein
VAKRSASSTQKEGSSGKFVGKKQPGVTGTQPKAS